jgi:hypothetical protein
MQSLSQILSTFSFRHRPRTYRTVFTDIFDTNYVFIASEDVLCDLYGDINEK